MSLLRINALPSPLRYVYILLLAALQLRLSQPVFRFTFFEDDPFEQKSIVAWIFTALIIIVRIGPLELRAWAFTLLCVIFVAGE